MKKNESGDKGRPAPKVRRKSLSVVCSDGLKQRFLRGIVTSDLVRRGVDFDAAYAVANAVRGRLVDHTEVPASEVRQLVDEEVRKRLSEEQLSRLWSGTRPDRADLRVVANGQDQPFSLGLLARSVAAAGVELEEAYGLAARVEDELRRDAGRIWTNHEIARRMASLLEQGEGPRAARRYRLVRRIHRLERPLILYVGGASGTGKSSLAMELAPLLRIFRVIATDTIRQVMRMVFTPAILPALHASSFEAEDVQDTLLDAARSPEYPTRLVTSYEEQATRVCVGIRAVVERAIAENMSIIVEGVHLHPGLVPFADLEGSAYQVSMVLSTMNEEVHRPRFLARARRGTRAADRYLEHFEGIRIIHEHLLQEADRLDVPVVDTSGENAPTERMVQLVTGLIEGRLPHLAEEVDADPAPPIPTLMLCVDGLGDRPVRALGGRTPLQAASLPVLDRLAREGRLGSSDPVGPGVVPDTASGSLAAFGQSPRSLKRGPVEALGAGLKLKPGDIAFRGNFATLDEHGRVVDRRAGRIREGTDALTDALAKIELKSVDGSPVKLLVSPSTEHRLAVVLRCRGLSASVLGSDPGDGVEGVPPLEPRAADPNDARAVETARLLTQFETRARKVLADHPVNASRREKGLPEANAVLTRGAGHVHRLIPLEAAGKPLRIACVCADRTIRGIATLLGAEIHTDERMTANLDTDLGAKFEAARQALESNDLVALHVKGADIAAHDCRPDLKVAFLERLDGELGRLLENRSGPLRVVVVSDHATYSESGQHGADPLPVLTWGTEIEADNVESFDESSAAGGALGRFPLPTLIWRLFGED